MNSETRTEINDHEVTLADLELIKPPERTTQKNRRLYTISYEKNGDPVQDKSICIQRISAFGFSFSFVNRNVKQDSLRYAFQVVPLYGDISHQLSKWDPPHWVALPIRKQESTYKLTKVSWCKNYHRRFCDLSLRQRIYTHLKNNKVKS